MGRLRKVIVGVIIVSFAIAAIGGIVALLGSELGETAARVLGTTAVVGVFSVAVLCCSALIGRPVQAVGLVGIVVAVATAAMVLVFVWADSWPGDPFSRLTWTGVVATIALSFGSLLLLLADRRRAAVRVGLVVTLALFFVIVALIVFAVWVPEAIDGTSFSRVVGITGILAALGAIVVPVLSLLLPEDRAARAAVPGHATVSEDLARRLAAEAERRGVSVDELVEPILRHERGAS